MSDLEREKLPTCDEPMFGRAYSGVIYCNAVKGHTGPHSHTYSCQLTSATPSPTRESLHAEWMVQEKWLDWSNFLLHKLTGEAGSPAPAPTDEK